MDNICRGCNKTIETTVVTCEHCYKTYHPACTTFKKVLNKADKLINACRSCISAANINKQKTKSINESITENIHVTTQTAPVSESEKLHLPLNIQKMHLLLYLPARLSRPPVMNYLANCWEK